MLLDLLQACDLTDMLMAAVEDALSSWYALPYLSGNASLALHGDQDEEAV